MDWLTQYWPYLIAGVLLVVLAARAAVVLLPKYQQTLRHSGERAIRVIGVGGAGGNAVNHMIRAKQRGVDYVAVNTDAQVLDDSLAQRRVQIGEQLTQGLGAGGDAAIGRQAAEEDAEEIAQLVAGSDLVFIAAGLGGGTGSGAAPVIAAHARKAGALTVGVVTRPFDFEGAGRRKIADAATAELKAHVDTLLLIENQRVLGIVGEDTSMLDAFTAVNEVLAGTVRAVVDIMTVPGLINLDFADVRAIMQDGGMATAGIGAAVGPDRALVAAQAAVANPLLNHDLAGAGAILLNVAGASGMTMREVTRAAEVIRSAADPDAMIIFGTIFDDHLDDELRVTVIATRLRDSLADDSRAAEDVRSIAATDEPTPAAAVQATAASAAAVQLEEAEEDAEEDAPRWAAIPIVTSEAEPVPVLAYGAAAVADDTFAEPSAPWAASQAYVIRDEPAAVEEQPEPARAGEPWFPLDAAVEPEPEEVAEPAPAADSWFAPTDAPQKPVSAGAPWFDRTDEAPDSEPPAAWSAPAEEVAEPEPWAASAQTAPSEPLTDEAESEPTASTPKFLLRDEPTASPAAEPAAAAELAPPAEPPWYDPGDNTLEAARSAATPALTPPEEPEAATAPEPNAAPASSPPGNVVVSGQAASGAPEPPPSQLARRTTQAVLAGVWKRMQKPPQH